MRTSIGFVVLLSMILTVCRGEHVPQSPLARLEEPQHQLFSQSLEADTLLLNSNKTEIAWKGTKMWGRGMHTGVVPLKEGYLLFHRNRLKGGFLIVDMTSIGITDIPPDQPEPIRILTKHLEGEAFLDVSRYPEASFVFSRVRYHTDGELTISGVLTVKDVSRQIMIPASVDTTGRIFISRFRINRFDWNISYRGGFGVTWLADRNFVDKYIELDIKLQAEGEEPEKLLNDLSLYSWLVPSGKAFSSLTYVFQHQ